MFTENLFHIVATFNAPDTRPMVVSYAIGYDNACRMQAIFKANASVSYSIQRVLCWK